MRGQKAIPEVKPARRKDLSNLQQISTYTFIVDLLCTPSRAIVSIQNKLACARPHTYAIRQGENAAHQRREGTVGMREVEDPRSLRQNVSLNVTSLSFLYFNEYFPSHR